MARAHLPLVRHLKLDTLVPPPPAWSADLGDGTFVEPGPARGLLRPRCRPGRRRLLDDGVQLRSRPGPSDPPLARPRQLDARRSCAPAPRARRGLPGSAARQGRVGSRHPSPRRPVLDLLPRPRLRHLRHDGSRPAGRVEPSVARPAGEGADRSLPAVGRRRHRLARPRLGAQSRRIQQRHHPAPADAGRPGGGGRRRSRHRRRERASWIPHPRGTEALQARRRVPPVRAGRGSRHGLAVGLSRPRHPRPLPLAHRSRPGALGGQRTAPGCLGRHALGRGLVPALPGQGPLRSHRAPRTDDLERGWLADHRLGSGRQRAWRAGDALAEARAARRSRRRSRPRRTSSTATRSASSGSGRQTPTARGGR